MMDRRILFAVFAVAILSASCAVVISDDRDVDAASTSSFFPDCILSEFIDSSSITTDYDSYLVHLPPQGAAGQYGGLGLVVFDNYQVTSGDATVYSSGATWVLIITGSGPVTFTYTLNGTSYSHTCTVTLGYDSHPGDVGSRDDFTLCYNANGGSGAPSTQRGSSYVSYYDFIISSTIPTRDGYTFLGWATYSAASTASYEAGDTIRVSNTTTLYAVWEEDEEVVEPEPEYTITYVAYSPATAQSVTVEEGSYEIIDVYTTVEGYSFTGWLCSNGTTYQPGDVIQVTSDLTFTGQWEALVFTVTFYPDNGEDPFTMTVSYGDTIDFPDEPSKTGYTFAHWRDADGVIWGSSRTVTSDVSLFADYDQKIGITYDWRNNGATITVTYPTTTIDVGYDLDDYLEQYPGVLVLDEGVEFLGWYYSDGTPVEFPFETEMELTLYAMWSTDDEPPVIDEEDPPVDDHLVGILAALAILFVLYLTIRSGRSFRRR